MQPWQVFFDLCMANSQFARQGSLSNVFRTRWPHPQLCLKLCLTAYSGSNMVRQIV